MGGSKIWVKSKDPSTQGWDFGTSGSSPIPLLKTSIERPLLELIGGPSWQDCGPPYIKDTVTSKEIFHLPGKYVYPQEVQWDGQYLVVGYDSGEVLILDVYHLYTQ